MTPDELASIRHRNNEAIKHRDQRAGMGYDDGFLAQLECAAVAAHVSNRLLDEIQRLNRLNGRESEVVPPDAAIGTGGMFYTPKDAVDAIVGNAERHRADTAKDPDSWGKDDPRPKYEPAFPITGGGYGDHPGMSLREYFAGQALVGFQQFVRGGWCGVMDQKMADDMADNCFAIADAMLRRG